MDPVVNASKCTGCSKCVEGCRVKCLEIADGIAVLPQPDTCGSEEHCITECRDDTIHMARVPMEGQRSSGRLALRLMIRFRSTRKPVRFSAFDESGIFAVSE